MNFTRIFLIFIVALSVTHPIVARFWGAMSVGRSIGRFFHSIYTFFNDKPDDMIESEMKTTRKAPALASNYGSSVYGLKVVEKKKI